MENKVNVIAKDGAAQVFIGKHVQQLDDRTTSTFVTGDPRSFVNYCENLIPLKGGEIPYNCDGEKHIYYSPRKIVLMDPDITRYTKPIAVCSIEQSPVVTILEESINTPLSKAGFADLLFALRDFLDADGKDLRDSMKNFKASKTTTIIQEKDNLGNYNNHFKRENSGTDNTPIPETIKFTIPVLGDLTTAIKKDFVLDLMLDFRENEGRSEVFFVLKTPLWKLMKEENIRSALAEYLSELDCRQYWGDVEITPQNNAWQFVYNGT